ncbi:hypothetical protein [Desulfitobacterium sp. PCE1]|uniref:hypothetical protein n=1 Tax=Desulfitobacterium sp. PCE1 TaxID=146907 RepID=UPI000363CFF5|nr:hypothetical protein [Desulfitobacterium sp. PCE1]
MRDYRAELQSIGYYLLCIHDHLDNNQFSTFVGMAYPYSDFHSKPLEVQEEIKEKKG